MTGAQKRLNIGILLVVASLWPFGFNGYGFLAGCALGAGLVTVVFATFTKPAV